MDGGSFPQDLKDEIYAYLRENMADERGENDTDEQFLYKTRKKAWGPFKQRVWDMPEQMRADIGGRLQEKFEFLYDKLGATNSRDLVARHVTPARISKPAPASLRSAVKS